MHLDLDRIIQLEKDGWVRVQQHPERPLFVANYSEKTVHKKHWGEYERMCRGLIFNDEGIVVGRPFEKFWNLGESWEPEKPAPLPPDEPFTVSEKKDGSLGIVFYDPSRSQWDLASRGSFTSEQAVTGRCFLYDRMDERFMDKRLTYCVEIVYPENRIVVDYGSERNLYVIAAIETETGKDCEFVDFGFPRVREYKGVTGIEELMAKYEGEKNFEGFVFRYQSGLRLKAKLPEYLRLHKLVVGVNSRRIWECLAAGTSLDEYLDRVPDDVSGWVTNERDRLLCAHRSTTEYAESVFRLCKAAASGQAGAQSMEVARSVGLAREFRKAFAAQAARHPSISGLLFVLLDGGSIDALVWKMLKPEEVTTPFGETL